jgi:hypothetical protein
MSNPTGVQNFYYSKQVPDRAISIARVLATPSRPSDLTDINNTAPATLPSGLGPTALTITSYPSEVVVDAHVLNNPVSFSGSIQYVVPNQFFEITDTLDASGNPLFYKHVLPVGVVDAVITDLDNNPVDTKSYMVQSGCVYHSFSGAAFWITYYFLGQPKKELLMYTPVLTPSLSPVGNKMYLYYHSVLQVPTTGSYIIRFTQANGYQVLPPYDGLLDDPWYVRVRFNPNPPAPEWARQPFQPTRGYMLATWASGAVIDPHIIEFDRGPIFWDGQTYPDVLVFDSSYKLKYALDGSQIGTPEKRGFLYPWRRAQFAPNGIDPYKARVNVNVLLDPTDIIYGFFFYAEPDVLYTDLDVNPHANPDIWDKVIEFYCKPASPNPLSSIYYRILNPDGSSTGKTNDPAPGSGSVVTIATVIVGASVQLNQYQITDSRERGGGLAPPYANDPNAASFWDLGFWDGKPYPLGGTFMVYLPESILQPTGTFTRDSAAETVKNIVPMGTIPIIRFYDGQGREVY